MASWMISRLDEETRDHHAEADSDSDILFRHGLTVSDYLAYLVRQYGFEAPLESAIGMTPGFDAILALKERYRAGRLAEDLLALGVRPQKLAELPQCLAVPHFRGAAEAIGWMYVTERGTLTHSVVRGHLLMELPREMPRASAYLSSYAGMVGTRWRVFGEALDALSRTKAIGDAIVAAAHAAFRAQRRWLTQDPAALRATA